MPTSKTNTHQMWQPLLQNLQRPLSSLPLWIEEVVFNCQVIKFIILSAGLIFEDLSRNFLNVSQYQDNTEVKSYPVQSHIIFSRGFRTWWLLCHSTKYLETSPDLFTSYIDFILPQTLFAKNSVKILIFSQKPPKTNLL